MVQHWKCCVLQKGTVGSNPTLSAILPRFTILPAHVISESAASGRRFENLRKLPGLENDVLLGANTDGSLRVHPPFDWFECPWRANLW